MDLDLDEAQLRRIVDHVFPPRKLPGETAESLVEDEANILGLLTSVVNSSEYSNLIPISTRDLFETWNINQTFQNPKNIGKSLRTLGKEGMFGYYVRAQNAGIFICSNNDATVTLSTFPASLKSEIVMSNRQGEIVAVYPEQSITVPNSNLLHSEAVARQIITLTNEVIVDAMPTTTKAGSQHKEVREVQDTIYVSEWLTCLLSDANSRVATEFPRICKKVRDNVTWNNSLIPFRRSGMWMTAKVILELSLVKSTSQKKGIFLYKLIMAEFMRKICGLVMKLKASPADPDVGMFMIKKLARRVKKVQIFKAKDLLTYTSILLSKTSETCKLFKMQMTNRWEQEQQTTAVMLEGLRINRLVDTVHNQLPNIPSLKVLTQHTRLMPNEAPACPPRVDLYSEKAMGIPKFKSLVPDTADKHYSEKLGNILFETESWMLKYLDFYANDLYRSFAKSILELADDYIRIAVVHYQSNPVRMSRMVLTFLKAVQVLDQIAMACYPMLAEHRVGINPVLIHQLLLPLKSDLEVAHELDLYFQQRDKNAKFPALTEEDAITAESFSVRYGSQNLEMCELRDKILLDAEHDILGKKGELKHAKKVCNDLRVDLRVMICACGSPVWRCTCCRLAIQKTLDSQSVEVYERPLRNEEENRIAVVFELLVPEEIACLRDILTLVLSTVVCRAKKKPYQIEGRIWTDYEKLRKYKRWMDIQKYFKLGSTIKLFVDSHYREGHPDREYEDFIVNNGYDCTFAGNYEKIWDVKRYCTLLVTPNSHYANMQWTLETTKHTQNEVLASQVKCPAELRLVEYKEFGSLRAGHRLQLRNIMRAMIEKSLSFKEESVFSLICQAVWEAGPSVPGTTKSAWHRESHQDLSNVNFAEEFCEELATQLEAYQNNWDEPYTLLIIVVLTCRVLEFGQVNVLASDLLLKCRTTAYDWICRIEEMITKSFDSPVDHVHQLKLKVVDACICLCWTYSVGSEYTDLILKSEADFFYWIHAKARIYNIVTSSTTTLSDTKNMLIEQIRNNSLSIESKLTKFVHDGLNKFVRSNWKEGIHGLLHRWEPFEHPAAHVYHTTFRREGNQGDQGIVRLQVDVLRGSFLVNGVPVGYLPESITEHATFSRIFRNIAFEVHPALEAKTFVTTHLYNNADYRFTFLGDDIDSIRNLLILERNNTDEFQLVPHQLFSNLIPFLLVRDYSHWLNLNTSCIDFRPIEFSQFGKEKVKFRLDLKTKLLSEVSTGNVLFCVTSPTHNSITKYLGRLEDSRYIHAMDQNGKVTIQLPRMRLTFQFNEETSHLKSLEYGMEVCPVQSFGTLIGLNNGLLIKNEYGDKRILIPHGLANTVVTSFITSNKDDHQRVQIDLENLSKPSFFSFDVDDQLQQLRARKCLTGWLYLAYLHAITASPLADPFTGLTGTESAFKILQSGLCWSCKPYEDQASLDILREIKNLSPIRQYYPQHLQRMERVIWPARLPSSAAQDGFRFIVDKLLTDSKRLANLFANCKPVTDDVPPIEKNCVVLSERAYIRYEQLCSDEGRIAKEFLDLVSSVTHQKVSTSSWTTSKETILHNTRIISELGHSWDNISVPANVSLTNLLTTREKLQGLTDPIALTQMSIVELLKLDFRNNWINMYELARLVKKENFKSEWATILSILAFRGLDLKHLILLQTVAVQRIFFQTQDPPKHQNFPQPNYVFNEGKVNSIFTASNIDHGTAKTLTSLIQVLWPKTQLFELTNFEDFALVPNFGLSKAIDVLNRQLVHWNQNYELTAFLKKIENTLAVVPTSNCRQPTLFLELSTEKLFTSFANKAKFELEYNAMVVHTLASKKYKKSSANIFETGFKTFSSTSKESDLENDELLEHFQEQVEFYGRLRSKFYGIIKDCLVYNETDGLFHSDLFRVTPTSLLTSLLHFKKIDPDLRNLIGSYGVFCTLEQRANRCVRYILMGKTGLVPLMRERENRGHLNWKPSEKPEWLVFEIESNLMIRPVQVDVAQQMIVPPGEKHSVMQLNMGEGKTAVIVPLLALMLANGNLVFRVTVLKSLFKTNMESLVFCLGGLLNRRVYTFPCQRDFEIGSSTAKTMSAVYEECRLRRGAVITLPEHRLSFQLKAYEKCRARDFGDAKPLLELRSWLAKNVRDILDESDEILHAKYQLIYTMGSQLPIDGGALRWTVAQCLLKLIPTRMMDLQKKFGDSYVDTCQNNNERPDIFHQSRILKKECFQQLIEWLASDILDRKSPGIKVPELLPRDRQLIMGLLTNTSIDEESHHRAFKLLVSTQEASILILMGYLKYEILYLVLSKRWRVSYGVDVEGNRKMAVPFRAKDIPSKRSEFGHPDVAILLTQLSYYYSGLSDKELEECFIALNFVTNKEEEYASWIRQIPIKFVDKSIRNFTGVNLADQKQKYELLFPVLKKSMAVVDFWLSQTVFPKESRVFEKKLVCTPWDMCSEDFDHPITGFSGTNDSSTLLPAPIQQQDLPQLQSTNDDMRNIIMLEENNNVDILARGITAVEILQKLVDENIPVLLDPGALILELDNEGVARTWLELLQKSGMSNIEAAVYFDDDNELRVKLVAYLDDSVSFHTSSYVDKLDRCVIYLDDVHTRGTDLKIPPPSKACVTLCAGITRDKMVQACMRMRLLGKGHTIRFFANDEAGDAIKVTAKKRITSSTSLEVADVLKWVCTNSTLFEKDGLVYWAASGINYAHKRVVEAAFNTKKTKTVDDYFALGEICCDQEFQILKQMYGEYRHELNYLDVLKNQIVIKKDRIKEQLQNNSLHRFLSTCPIFNTFGASVFKRCHEVIPDKKVVSQLLDEEQEKELEVEPEQEVYITRPSTSTPAQHKLSEGVVFFVKFGDINLGLRQKSILLMHQTFERTTMWSLLEDKRWCSEQVYVTKDFTDVIISGSSQDKVNEFLRTPNWVTTFQKNKDSSSTIMLLLSPYEANELLPLIRGLSNGAQLRMFSPRLAPQQSIMIESGSLVLPYSNDNFGTIPRNLLPPLFLLSGTLYFVNTEEEKYYSYFTGMLPCNSRTEIEKQAVKDGKIKRGFLIPLYREEISPPIHQFCGFAEHPEIFVREIMETLHGHFPPTSHVSQLILDCREVTDFTK